MRATVKTKTAKRITATSVIKTYFADIKREFDELKHRKDEMLAAQAARGETYATSSENPAWTEYDAGMTELEDRYSRISGVPAKQIKNAIWKAVVMPALPKLKFDVKIVEGPVRVFGVPGVITVNQDLLDAGSSIEDAIEAQKVAAQMGKAVAMEKKHPQL